MQQFSLLVGRQVVRGVSNSLTLLMCYSLFVLWWYLINLADFIILFIMQLFKKETTNIMHYTLYIYLVVPYKLLTLEWLSQKV